MGAIERTGLRTGAGVSGRGKSAGVFGEVETPPDSCGCLGAARVRLGEDGIAKIIAIPHIQAKSLGVIAADDSSSKYRDVYVERKRSSCRVAASTYLYRKKSSVSNTPRVDQETPP